VILLVPLVGLNAVRDGVFRGLKEPFWAILPSQILQPLIVLLGVVVLLYLGALDK
jgi:Na+-driven multidrug efflux pump